MFKSYESPMVALLDPRLGAHKIRFDQCPSGAKLHGNLVQKSSELHSNRDLSATTATEWPDQPLLRDRSHEHMHLRGHVWGAQFHNAGSGISPSPM